MDIVGSFEAAALSAPLTMSTSGHPGFDTRTRENLCIQASRGGSPRRQSVALTGRMQYNVAMGRQTIAILYVVAMVIVIIGVDIVAFRHHFWPRLLANVGIVLLFAAFYLRFLKN
ncbi:MAG: hypothetical protein FWE35_19010 [Streptosporangiales bacterium]|nr:hypothetical protein [Streptosporangiales bacterium]